MTLNTTAITNGKLVNKISWKRCLGLKCIPKYGFLPKNKLAILKIYIEAQIKNLTRRGKWQVDHIIPLSNPYVCGLHVPCNLQVLSRTQNTNKTNNFTPYREVNGKKYYFNALKTSFKPFKIRKSYNPTKKTPTKLVKKRSKVVKTGVKRLKRLKKR